MVVPLVFFLLLEASSVIHLELVESSQISLTSGTSIKSYQSLQYYIPLSIGSSYQNLTFIIDTGSSWLWLPSSGCSCHQSSKFNTSTSSSYKSSNTEIEVNYGIGQIKGVLSQETVRFVNLTATNQIFILATEDNHLDNVKSDGILGLAFNSLSKNKLTLIETLKNQGQIESAVFSIYLSPLYSKNRSFFTIGGFVSDGFDNQGKVLKIVKDFGYWISTIDSFQFGSEGVKDYSYALIDSGTSGILGPNKQVAAIKNEVKNSFDCIEDDLLTCYCEKTEINILPDLKLFMQGQEFVITPLNYMYYGGGRCYLLIHESNDFFWLLGQPFLREYYSVFDMDQVTITFLQKASQKSNSSPILFVVLGLSIPVLVFLKRYYANNAKPQEIQYSKLA